MTATFAALYQLVQEYLELLMRALAKGLQINQKKQNI
jgi:hypothetical protein